MRTLLTERSDALVPMPLRLPVAVIAVVSAATALIIGLAVAGTSAPSSADTWVQSRVHGFLSGVPNLTFAVVRAGNPEPMIVMSTLLSGLCGLLRRPFHALLALAGPFAAGAVTSLLKPAVGRTFEGVPAFPSGHTAGVTALALVAGLLVISIARAQLAVAVSVATAVVLLAGVAIALALVAQDWHYATDTVGGFCTAIAVVAALAFFVDACRSALFRKPG